MEIEKYRLCKETRFWNTKLVENDKCNKGHKENTPMVSALLLCMNGQTPLVQLTGEFSFSTSYKN